MKKLNEIGLLVSARTGRLTRYLLLIGGLFLFGCSESMITEVGETGLNSDEGGTSFTASVDKSEMAEKSALLMMPIPAYNYTFTASLTRGFWFQAPVDFTITGLRVPDETGHGLQNVEVFKSATPFPAYPGSVSGGQVFYSTGVPSGQIIPTNIHFEAGDYVGILGAAGDASNMRNSYGAAGPFTSEINGIPVQIARFLTQFNIVASGGNNPHSTENDYNVGRVEVYIKHTIDIDIDIKPGSDPNSINCTTSGNGIVTVAILSTDEFDALTVDHATVSFEGASETHVDKNSGAPRRHEEDVNGDGDLDLVLHFRIGETGLTCDSSNGTVSGSTYDGTDIEGTDTVRMVNHP